MSTYTVVPLSTFSNSNQVLIRVATGLVLTLWLGLFAACGGTTDVVEQVPETKPSLGSKSTSKPETAVTESVSTPPSTSIATADTNNSIDSGKIIRADSPKPPSNESAAQPDQGNPLTQIINGNDQNKKDCVLRTLGQERFQQLLTQAPNPKDMETAGPCIAGQGPPRGAPSDQARNPTQGNPLTQIINGNDQIAKTCLLQAIGKTGYTAISSGSTPTKAQMDFAGPCLAGKRTVLTCDPPKDVSSTAWVLENTLFSRHYWGIETPFKGRQGPFESTGSADPRVIRLPDGSYRMYFAGGDLKDSTYVRTATSKDGINFSLAKPYILDVPKGSNGGGAHLSLLPLDDGTWRIYSSTRSTQDRHVLSYSSPDGLQLTQEPGKRLTLNAVGGGDLMSPYVIADPAGGYRMFLTKVPEGEKIGQVGGNTTAWVVIAKSQDGLTWSITDQVIDGSQRPSVIVKDDGSLELWVNHGMASGLFRINGKQDLSTAQHEYMNIWAVDADVHQLSNGEYRVYGGFGSVYEGGSIRVLRSVTVPWSVEIKHLGMNNSPEGDILGVCLHGESSDTLTLETHHSLAERIPISTHIVQANGKAPFDTALIHVGDEPPHRDLWLTISDGQHIQEYRLTDYIPQIYTGVGFYDQSLLRIQQPSNNPSSD